MPMTDRPFLLDALSAQPPDPILMLIGLHQADPRPDKIDLGVGVYRDEGGETPIFAAVKEAERLLFARETTKTYLGAMGNAGFNAAVQALLFGPEMAQDPRIAAIQTPGGTGALRVAAELIAAARPRGTIWLGAPPYPNHPPIFGAAGLAVKTFPHFDPATQHMPFAEACAMLEAEARPGDVVLLHGSCHNPTGADLSFAQWQAMTELMLARELVPLVDIAYHGLAAPLDEDAAGWRHLLARVPEAIATYSCSKTFGLYRERTGATFALTRRADQAEAAASTMAQITRFAWSMPPDHGAELVRMILESTELAQSWRDELGEMRDRIVALRNAMATTNGRLAGVSRQRGLFSMLPLAPDQVERLRSAHGIYMTAQARINVAGIRLADVPRFATAVDAV